MSIIGLAVLLLMLFCTVYVTKHALDSGASARWILLWVAAVTTVLGIFVIGTYVKLRGDHYHDQKNGTAAVAAVSILFFPLSPFLALGYLWQKTGPGSNAPAAPE